MAQPNADIPFIDVQDPEGKVKRLRMNHLLLLKEHEETRVNRPVYRPHNLVRLEESSVRETETTHRRPIPKPRRQGKEIYGKQVVEESPIKEVRFEQEIEDESKFDMECTVVYPRERLTGQDRDRGNEIQGQEDM